MRGYRQTIEKLTLTDKLTHKISISSDEDDVFLTVKYQDGKRNFLVEKTFKNSYTGLEQLSDARNKFRTEESVLDYLGIDKEKNNE